MRTVLHVLQGLSTARQEQFWRHFSWKALAEIYTMHSFAPFFNLKISAESREVPPKTGAAADPRGERARAQTEGPLLPHPGARIRRDHG